MSPFIRVCTFFARNGPYTVIRPVWAVTLYVLTLFDAVTGMPGL
jgi:hypothetical protein